jgi:RNA polymerase sigma-70 factor, ECF subfamily
LDNNSTKEARLAVRARAESPGEERLVAELQAGDETAFAELLDAHGASMLRVAQLYVRDSAVAEEVVQETWLRVLRSLGMFEGRSSLRTWIFVILGNVARRRAEQESRTVALPEEPGRAVEAERFFPAEHPRWAQAWSTTVSDWDGLPEGKLLADEALGKFREAVAELPEQHAAVITLRDVEGWTADEVCGQLGLSQANQRVLLHRARSKVRGALEEYFGMTG